MATTITIDDDLLERAISVSGIAKKDDVVQEALTALIHREAARRAIALAGTEPDLEAPPRHRPDLEASSQHRPDPT